MLAVLSRNTQPTEADFLACVERAGAENNWNTQAQKVLLAQFLADRAGDDSRMLPDFAQFVGLAIVSDRQALTAVTSTEDEDDEDDLDDEDDDDEDDAEAGEDWKDDDGYFEDDDDEDDDEDDDLDDDDDSDI